MSCLASGEEQLERSLGEADAADIGAGGELDAAPSGEQAPSAKTATAPRHPAIARIIFPRSTRRRRITSAIKIYELVFMRNKA
jgi:hypothetical protein